MSLRDLSEPLKEVVFTVASDEGGMRLDAWLRLRVPWRSRTDLQRRIGDGRILVDGRSARKSTRVQVGQEVRVVVDEGPATEDVPVGRIPIRVIWEDPWIVALDKAPGTVVHPVGRHVMDTIINALHVRYADAGSPEVRPMIVHRLDRDTSGVLVLAKDVAVRKTLGRAFEDRDVRKTYLAAVLGEVDDDRGSITAPIGPDQDSEIRLKVACRTDGKPSRTDYEVLERAGPVSLVRCFPRTGRQHQIRVHLAHIGHPILCDKLYGCGDPVRALDLDPGGNDAVVLARQALHAESLEFCHPRTEETVRLEVPLPEDLRALFSA